MTNMSGMASLHSWMIVEDQTKHNAWPAISFCATLIWSLLDSKRTRRNIQQQDMNRISRLCRLKEQDMTKGVHYPIWMQRNAKAISKSFLQGGIPVRPSEGCTFSQETPNEAICYSSGRTGPGNRGSQEDEGRTSVQWCHCRWNCWHELWHLRSDCSGD